MRSPLSLATFTAAMLLALLMALAGLGLLLSGSILLGMVLLIAAFGLSSFARNARAAQLYRHKMTGLSQWAQALGPRKPQGRRRRP